VSRRRAHPLVDEAALLAAIDARSLYAAPFPLEVDVDKVGPAWVGGPDGEHPVASLNLV
jgi:hypothetical protein